MKRYLLGAALTALTGALCPSPAHATTPALLPFQQVPSFSCGPAAGTDAATDANAAGFTTCALGNDFTASTGTGWTPSFSGSVSTTSNWLDCGFGSNTSAIWHFGASDRNSSPGNPGCSSVFQTTDGGGSVLDLQVPYSSTSSSGAGVFLETQNFSDTGGRYYPNGYYEITFRCSPGCGNGQTHGDNINFWTWQGASGLLEKDFLESGYGANGDVGFNNWSSTDCGAGFNDCSSAILYRPTGDITTYHTWATLYTGNGSGGWSLCWYYDNARQGCRTGSYTSDANVSGKSYLRLENQVIVNSPAQSPSWVGGNADYFVKNVKVLSCSAWQTSGSSGMCNGSTLNGTGYYQ